MWASFIEPLRGIVHYYNPFVSYADTSPCTGEAYIKKAPLWGDAQHLREHPAKRVRDCPIPATPPSATLTPPLAQGRHTLKRLPCGEMRSISGGIPRSG